MTVPTYGISAPPVRAGSAVDEIHSHVLRLFAMVSGGLSAATAAFLAGDREAARRLVAEDRLIDELQSSTEELVQTELSRPERSDDDLRLFVSSCASFPSSSAAATWWSTSPFAPSWGWSATSPR